MRLIFRFIYQLVELFPTHCRRCIVDDDYLIEQTTSARPIVIVERRVYIFVAPRLEASQTQSSSPRERFEDSRRIEIRSSRNISWESQGISLATLRIIISSVLGLRFAFMFQSQFVVHF